MTTRIANISAQEHAKSSEFIATLTKMMEIVEKISDKIPEGDYLELMDGFKKTYDHKDATTLPQIVRLVIHQDPVVQHHERRSKMRICERTKDKDDAYCLRKGLSVVCPKCDCVVAKKGLKEHQATRKCNKAMQSKSLTKDAKKKTTDRETRIIAHLNAFRLRRADNANMFSRNIRLLKRQKELGFSDEYALRIYGNYLISQRPDFNPDQAQENPQISRRQLFVAIEWIIQEYDKANPEEEPTYMS